MIYQNYNGFVRLKASKCERYVLSAIQTPTEALRAQKDPQNASLCACVPQPLCPKPLDSGLWFGLGGWREAFTIKTTVTTTTITTTTTTTTDCYDKRPVVL